MTQRTRLLDALVEDVGQDRQDYRQMLALLGQQQAFLLVRDSLSLQALNGQIESLGAVLRQRASRRSRILQAFSLTNAAGGMQQLLDSLDDHYRKPLAALWQELGDLARLCQQQNERNGRLLATQQEILAQLVGGQSSSLYEPAL